MQVPSKHVVFKLVCGFLQISLLSGVLSGIAVLVLRLLDVNIMGFTQLIWIRTWLVFAMFAYLVATLVLLGRPVGSMLLLVVPFLTQYYQVSLGNEYPNGANSIMRITPLLVMAVAMAVQVYHYQFKMSRNELVCALLLLLIGFYALAVSVFITNIGLTCFFLMVVLVPTFYFFSGSLVNRSPLGSLIVIVGLSIGLFVLLLGTIGTTLVGLRLDLANAAGTLAGTRSVNDFNTIYSYLILGWPFVFIILRQLHWSLCGLLVVLAIGATALGFSRVSFFLTPVLLAISFMVYAVRSPQRSLQVGSVMAIVLALVMNHWSLGTEIMNVWKLRFNLSAQTAVPSFGELLESVKPQSTDADTRLGLVDTALQLYHERPLFGHGWASFREVAGEGFSTAHNLTADLLVENGLIGVSFFWALVLVIFLSLSRLALRHDVVRADVMLLGVCIVLWLMVAHTLGAGFYIASVTGFQVNAITGMLFGLYLQPRLIKSVVSQMRPKLD